MTVFPSLSCIVNRCVYIYIYILLRPSNLNVVGLEFHNPKLIQARLVLGEFRLFRWWKDGGKMLLDALRGSICCFFNTEPIYGMYDMSLPFKVSNTDRYTDSKRRKVGATRAVTTFLNPQVDQVVCWRRESQVVEACIKNQPMNLPFQAWMCLRTRCEERLFCCTQTKTI